MSSDPLLQPYQLKHLTLRNRLMSTSHEPAYSEDGMPTDRYRLYHLEKAKGGIALTMTAGSAVVSEDSPAAFGNRSASRFGGGCRLPELDRLPVQLREPEHRERGSPALSDGG